MDRDIFLSLEPSPRPSPGSNGSAFIAPAAEPPALDVLDAANLSESLWQALARHQLLLPLLRHGTVAAAVAGVRLSDQERARAQQAWAAKHGIRSAEQLQAHLAAQALSEADGIWQAELPLRINRHCEEHFAHRAEQRFLARKNQLDQVIYSLLRVEDGALARELYLRIAEGEADFAELAATYSKGPERSTRGIVGPVPLSQGHPQLVDRLRTAEPGVLLEPFQIENWWLLVRVETMMPATYGPEAADAMKQRLLEEWLEEEVDRRLLQLPPLSAPVHS